MYFLLAEAIGTCRYEFVKSIFEMNLAPRSLSRMPSMEPTGYPSFTVR